MRNTLIKMLAVLALCVLTCVAFVACTEEEPVETATTLVSVSFNDKGFLVMNYDNGETLEVALPVAEECEHKVFPKYVLKKHTKDNDGKAIPGVTLYVCDTCGFAKLDTEVIDHEVFYEDGKQNPNMEMVGTPVAPTCQNEGYTKYACSDCGEQVIYSSEEDGVVACKYEGGRKYYEGATATSNICVDGGKIVTHCIYENDGCIATVSETVAATVPSGLKGAHTIADDAWTVVDPTINTAGTATGVCTREYCTAEPVVKTIPAFSTAAVEGQTAYTYTPAPRAKCTDDQIGTLVLNANTFIKYENVVVVEKNPAHVLFDKNGEQQFIYHGQECATDEFPEKTFIVVGTKDQEPISCKTTSSYFKCQDPACDGKIIENVEARAPHRREKHPTKDYAAQCEKEGQIYLYCPSCGLIDTQETIPALEHEWKYNNPIPNADYTEFSCTKSCKNGCDKQNVPVTFALVSNKVTVEPTCVSTGIRKIEYKLEGLDEVHSFEYTIYENRHSHNGQLITSSENSVYRWHDACGIQIYGGEQVTADAPIKGYFICEVDGCGVLVDIWVQKGDAATWTGEWFDNDPDKA